MRRNRQQGGFFGRMVFNRKAEIVSSDVFQFQEIRKKLDLRLQGYRVLIVVIEQITQESGQLHDDYRSNFRFRKNKRIYVIEHVE
ncbi:hypothetical protein D3C86_1697700 [compost metagenome]